MKVVALLSIALLGLAVVADAANNNDAAAAAEPHHFAPLEANADPPHANFAPLDASAQAAPDFAPLAAQAASGGQSPAPGKKFAALQWPWFGGWGGGWGYRRFRAWGPWGFGGFYGGYPGYYYGGWGAGYPYWY